MAPQFEERNLEGRSQEKSNREDVWYAFYFVTGGGNGPEQDRESYQAAIA
jgi:hypothetical protein